MGDEVDANPGSWDGMGLRGNQSGPIEIRDLNIPADRLIGPVGDGSTSNDEATDPFFLFGTASCWNGIALGMLLAFTRTRPQGQISDILGRGRGR